MRWRDASGPGRAGTGGGAGEEGHFVELMGDRVEDRCDPAVPNIEPGAEGREAAAAAVRESQRPLDPGITLFVLR